MDATGLEVWCSEDGKRVPKLASASYPVLDKEDKDVFTRIRFFLCGGNRYVRIIARVTPEINGLAYVARQSRIFICG